jgi:hypothetical protein
MRPNDLLGRRHDSRLCGVGPFDTRTRLNRRPELAAADREDAAASADIVFLRRERYRIVRPLLRLVGEAARLGIEAEYVSFASVGHRFRALHHVEAEVQSVPPEDVAHVVAADHDQLQADFFRDAFEARRAHLARRSDGETIAGDKERLAAVDTAAEIGDEIAECPLFHRSSSVSRPRIRSRRPG